MQLEPITQQAKVTSEKFIRNAENIRKEKLTVRRQVPYPQHIEIANTSSCIGINNRNIYVNACYRNATGLGVFSSQGGETIIGIIRHID